jgi:hypothetical protein
MHLDGELVLLEEQITFHQRLYKLEVYCYWGAWSDQMDRFSQYRQWVIPTRNHQTTPDNTDSFHHTEEHIILMSARHLFAPCLRLALSRNKSDSCRPLEWWGLTTVAFAAFPAELALVPAACTAS